MRTPPSKTLASLPTTMQGYTLPTFGEAEVLTLSPLPVPLPQKGEVLIKVKAFGINRPDILQRKGLYPLPDNASPLPGLEVAGNVVSLGEGVSTFQLEDQVCALTNGGGYAEYCCVPAGQCLPLPSHMDFKQAAALPETFFTVWSNLFMMSQLRPHNSLLVHGGSSGIGTTAIQMARAFGVTVFATAGSQEKCALCEELGAIPIHYKSQDFHTIIMQKTNQTGVNMILDMVGASYFENNLKTLTKEGTLILIALIGGAKATNANLGLVLRNRLTIRGTTLRPRSNAFKAEIAQQLYTKIWPLLEKGVIKPIVSKVYPFQDVVQAHKMMESGNLIGKIVIET
ncbi:NAD(P)H-quinone oxidoreductase [Entomobacter blattae]|uniref:Quinone oxidoreductase 1 n=1 Tax=Entomobacter blattae TaxID=2762277 RepID=A0A7H1NTA4_9PROT|nr:NAD(P)H-quinone oxidoreductase [Entomobacter blattae]QNT79014.1 Quinone oxidoreductase 1 [Entomobacter blattae]